MSHIIYLSLKGKKQGLISAGCSTPESIGNRYQAGRENEIQVLSVSHTVSRDQNAHHHPVSFTKPIDKSSPLLAMAIDGNELLEAVFLSYRTSPMGQLEAFYEIKLTGATIVDFACHYPHSINSNDQIPYETVQLDYKSISCRHLIAGTSGYSITQLAGREEGRPLLSGLSNVKSLVEETPVKKRPLSLC
ncbi:Hcp family type VI secretion system effector [Xenorhabdus bovienii]|uniref:Hcp family type VI secretion system effector n=1 Tax=Xenorhabdus bovienii TaxID=40576 RepID=UPI003DA3F8AF